MRIKKSVLLSLLAFFLFLGFSIFITFPLIFHLGDYATGLGDELLIAWIQSWVIHALFTNPLTLFNANIYFPYHNTLAYSDVFLTTSILTALPTYFIGQPIAANNTLFIFSLCSLGFSLYLLAYYVTKDFLASFLAGILAIFSPATMSFDVHLQVLFEALVPLSLLYFLFLLDSKKTRFLLLFLFCFLAQMYNSFLPGYFILFSVVIILLFRFWKKKKQFISLFSLKHAGIVIIVFALTIPVVLPYLQVSKQFHYVRDIRDSIHFAIQPEDMLYSSDTSRLSSFLNTLPFNRVSQNNEFKPGYLGFIFTILVLFSFYYSIKKKIWKKNILVSSFVVIALLGFILSLGPALHLGRHTIHKPFPIPLPYLLFYYLIPGFQGFRNSARWEMLFILASVVVIAFVVHTILKKRSTKFRIIIYSLLFVGIISEFKFPMHFVSVPQVKNFPKVYSWMATTPQNATFIELPIYNWNNAPYVSQEMLREYYSTANFRKIVNGYSGFSPPPWQKLVMLELTSFPTQNALQQLKNIGVQYIILHKDEYDTLYHNHYTLNNRPIASGSAILKQLKKRDLLLIKTIGESYIYKIR